MYLSEAQGPDQTWTIVFGAIGAILGITTILVTIWLFFRAHPKKQLEATLLNVLKFDTYNELGIHLHWEGSSESGGASSSKRLAACDIVSIRVTNTGRTPIQDVDFNRPVKLLLRNSEGKYVHRDYHPDFPLDNKPMVLTARVTDVSNDGVVNTGRIKHLEDGIKPSVMNPRDWFEVDYLITGHPYSYDVRSHVVGETKPIRLRSATDKVGRPWQGAVVAIIIAMVGAVATVVGALIIQPLK